MNHVFHYSQFKLPLLNAHFYNMPIRMTYSFISNNLFLKIMQYVIMIISKLLDR